MDGKSSLKISDTGADISSPENEDPRADISSQKNEDAGGADVRSSENNNIMHYITSCVQNMSDVDPVMKEQIVNELERPKTVCVMACGLTGVGKSTLLNGVGGEKAFEVGHLYHETAEVEEHHIEKENHKLILCDTPGFEDESGSEDRYLEMVKKKCANVDTLFYCISVDATRINLKNDLATLKKLWEALDKRVWNSCVIVLTFANSLIYKIEAAQENEVEINEVEIKTEYDRRIKEWEKKVLKTFKEAGIDPTNIPIVHAGHPNKPFLFPNDKIPWFTTFWRKVVDVSHPDGQNVLFFLNIRRIKSTYEETEEHRPIHEQPIIADENSFLDRLKKNLPSLTVAAGGGVGAAAVPVCGMLGAVAFGTTTFGLGTGVGLSIGAVLGGLIGSGIGAVIRTVDDQRSDQKAKENEDKEKAKARDNKGKKSNTKEAKGTEAAKNKEVLEDKKGGTKEAKGDEAKDKEIKDKAGAAKKAMEKK